VRASVHDARARVAAGDALGGRYLHPG
jgi:hypothetical protein